MLTDLEGTKNALVKASDLPLSVLIVGVGGADFTQMEVHISPLINPSLIFIDAQFNLK